MIVLIKLNLPSQIFQILEFSVRGSSCVLDQRSEGREEEVFIFSTADISRVLRVCLDDIVFEYEWLDLKSGGIHSSISLTRHIPHLQSTGCWSRLVEKSDWRVCLQLFSDE